MISATKKAISIMTSIVMFSASMGPVCYGSVSKGIGLSESRTKVTFGTKVKPVKRIDIVDVIEKECSRLEAQREAELKERIYLEKKSQEAKEAMARPNRGLVGSFKLTAYNLSENDCQRPVYSKYFGIASSGYDFKGKDITCRKIAVDTRVIAMGSIVYLEFPEDFNKVVLPDGTIFNLSGEYQAVDTGGAIRGNIIDLFVGGLGSGIKTLTNYIGVRQIKIYR